MREYHYGTLFDYSSEAIIIYDEQGCIINANKMASRLTGYEKSELLSLTVQDIHPGDSQEVYRGAYSDIKEHGATRFDVDFVKKDGEVFVGEVSSSLVEIDGKRLIQGVVRDVSERKIMEKELVEMKSIIDSMGELISICCTCKSVRDEGQWKKIESYMGEKINAEFSHGICPDCIKKVYAELEYLEKK